MSYEDLPLFAALAQEEQTSPAQIVCDDVLAWAETYDGPPFYAMLCDPPYSLGFMNKAWDGDIAFKADTWKALAQHLLPGAFGMCFASSRGWHRLACAIEDAGLIIHPSIFGWGFGQGFPKASRIDTQVDAQGGASIGWFGPWLRNWREERGIPQKELARHFPSKTGGLTGCVANWELGLNMPTVEQYNTLVQVLNLPFKTLEEAEREIIGQGISGKTAIWNEAGTMGDYDLTAPATPLAAAWAGHRYGLQMLKPALEPLITFVKPSNPFCAIMAETTFLQEVLPCILLPAQDAVPLLTKIHQALRAAVESFAHTHADELASLAYVTIAGDPSASSLAGVTLHDFVRGPAPTPDVISRLASMLTTGTVGNSSAWDTDGLRSMVDTLQSIAGLWSECLAELFSQPNRCTTSTTTSLITDLKILQSLLCQSISDSFTHRSEPTGLLSSVVNVEAFSQSVLIKSRLLSSTTATENASSTPADQANALEESQKAGASLSPIIVWQKPYQGKPVQSITQTGAGALWIDGGRIGTQKAVPYSPSRHTDTLCHGKYGAEDGTASGFNPNIGRWPPNFALCHTDQCVRVGERQVKSESGGHVRHNHNTTNGYNQIFSLTDCQTTGYADANGHETVAEYRCADNCPVAALDAQAGESVSRVGNPRASASPGNGYGMTHTGSEYNDCGGPSRFFHTSDWSLDIAERLAQADQVFYAAKESTSRREDGLLGHIACTAATDAAVVHEGDPLHTLRHCRVDATRQPILDKDGHIAWSRCRRNGHPTVKPALTLCQWLATLLLPPSVYAPRRLLVPFGGTASEAIGALLAGWDDIVMIEREAEYCDIARQRVAYWQQRASGA